MAQRQPVPKQNAMKWMPFSVLFERMDFVLRIGRIILQERPGCSPLLTAIPINWVKPILLALRAIPERLSNRVVARYPLWVGAPIAWMIQQVLSPEFLEQLPPHGRVNLMSLCSLIPMSLFGK